MKNREEEKEGGEDIRGDREVGRSTTGPVRERGAYNKRLPRFLVEVGLTAESEARWQK